jgi:hypothetical protein
MKTCKFYKQSFLICSLLLIIIFNISLFAQDTSSISFNESELPILKTSKLLPIKNNFRFIPSDVIVDPFITTYFKSSVGAGAALDLKSYVKDLNGNVIDTLSGKLSYISGDLQFQYAFNNWLAVNVSYGGAGRLGNNAYTILTSGISYATGFTLGGKIRIWENKEMILSGSIDYKSSDVFLYSIYDFAKKVVEAGTIDAISQETLLEKDKISSVFLNLNYAFAPADWCGLLAIAGWGSANTFNTKTRGNNRFGLAASVDFDNVKYIGIPVGILISVKYNKFSENGENLSNTVISGLRIGYTGHKDFDLGIENTYQSINYRMSDVKIKSILTALKIRYFF